MLYWLGNWRKIWFYWLFWPHLLEITCLWETRSHFTDIYWFFALRRFSSKIYSWICDIFFGLGLHIEGSFDFLNRFETNCWLTICNIFEHFRLTLALFLNIFLLFFRPLCRLISHPWCIWIIVINNNWSIFLLFFFSFICLNWIK